MPQIRENRKRLGLSPKELAERVSVAPESLSRWEKGVLIQSRSTDKLLRSFFRHPNDPVWRGEDQVPVAS